MIRTTKACGESKTAVAREGKLGVLGMEERARLIGGDLEIKSEPGIGTTVILEVPAQ
ncbi:hypothetical protein ES703_107034 [subsurface metagenome]